MTIVSSPLAILEKAANWLPPPGMTIGESGCSDQESAVDPSSEQSLAPPSPRPAIMATIRSPAAGVANPSELRNWTCDAMPLPLTMLWDGSGEQSVGGAGNSPGSPPPVWSIPRMDSSNWRS